MQTLMMDRTDGSFSWFYSKGEIETFEMLDYACVYALGPEKGRPVRIGWAKQPANRIRTLQEAHWQPLKLHTLVWLPGQQMAQRLEAEVQRLLTQGGRKISGSWYDVPLDMIPSCVTVAADNLRLNTWNHDAMVQHVRTLHENKINRAVKDLTSV